VDHGRQSPLFTDILQSLGHGSRRRGSSGTHKVLVDTDEYTLPDDGHEDASDPTFPVVLAWTGNHLEYLATSIDSRSKVLEARRDSELSSLSSLGRLFGDFANARFLGSGNRRWRHAGGRDARESNDFTAWGRETVISTERGDQIPPECVHHRRNDLADNQVELDHGRLQSVADEFGPFASFESLLEYLACFPRGMSYGQGIDLSRVERVWSRDVQVERLDKGRVGECREEE